MSSLSWVLLTAISPTWEDIGQLAAIVGIRTVLNFFLIQELREFGWRGGRETRRPAEPGE